MKEADTEPLYDVDVWGDEGNIVKHYRQIDATRIREVEKMYDEPWHTVIVRHAD